MDLTAISISVVSFVVVMGALVFYLSTIPSGKVPVRPIGLVFFLSLGILLAISSVVWNYQFSLSSHMIVNFPAFFAIFMGAFFLWVLTQRKTPLGDLKIKVGDQLLPFKVKTSEGKQFLSSNLMGKRTLFKFFRGGW